MRRLERRSCAQLATMLLSTAWDASMRALTAENSIANDVMCEHAKRPSSIAKRAIWDLMCRSSRFDMLNAFFYSGETRHSLYLFRVPAKSAALSPVILG